MRAFVGRARSGRARTFSAAFAVIRTRPPTPATRSARRSVGRSYATHEDREELAGIRERPRTRRGRREDARDREGAAD